MENLLTFALIVVLFLVAAVIAYTFVTNKIIKDQERELAALKTENKRLKNYIKVLNHAARSGHNIAPVDPEKAVSIRLFEQW